MLGSMISLVGQGTKPSWLKLANNHDLDSSTFFRNAVGALLQVILFVA